jgi:hypothetical protein
MEAVMSALGAIETPVAGAPDARNAAGPDLASRARPLRVVAGSAPFIAAPAADGTAAGTQPRSSSNPRAASGSVSAGAFRTGTVLAGTVLAGTVLTGTVVSRGWQRPRLAADAGVPRAQLRLTTRGRIVVATLVIVAVTAAALLITMLASGGAQATNHGQAHAGYQGLHQVVVRPGQTLWSLAAVAEPTADPRNVVQEIMSANALNSPSISAGQLLWVP